MEPITEEKFQILRDRLDHRKQIDDLEFPRAVLKAFSEIWNLWMKYPVLNLAVPDEEFYGIYINMECYFKNYESSGSSDDDSEFYTGSYDEYNQQVPSENDEVDFHTEFHEPLPCQAEAVMNYRVSNGNTPPNSLEIEEKTDDIGNTKSSNNEFEKSILKADSSPVRITSYRVEAAEDFEKIDQLASISSSGFETESEADISQVESLNSECEESRSAACSSLVPTCHVQAAEDFQEINASLSSFETESEIDDISQEKSLNSECEESISTSNSPVPASPCHEQIEKDFQEIDELDANTSLSSSETESETDVSEEKSSDEECEKSVWKTCPSSSHLMQGVENLKKIDQLNVNTSSSSFEAKNSRDHFGRTRSSNDEYVKSTSEICESPGLSLPYHVPNRGILREYRRILPNSFNAERETKHIDYTDYGDGEYDRCECWMSNIPDASKLPFSPYRMHIRVPDMFTNAKAPPSSVEEENKTYDFSGRKFSNDEFDELTPPECYYPKPMQQSSYRAGFYGSRILDSEKLTETESRNTFEADSEKLKVNQIEPQNNEYENSVPKIRNNPPFIRDCPGSKHYKYCCICQVLVFYTTNSIARHVNCKIHKTEYLARKGRDDGIYLTASELKQFSVEQDEPDRLPMFIREIDPTLKSRHCSACNFPFPDLYLREHVTSRTHILNCMKLIYE